MLASIDGRIENVEKRADGVLWLRYSVSDR
jgi:hypothetical protein